MPRTGSIGSKVGPAVISTRLPDSSLGCEEGDESSSDLERLEHAAGADFAAGLVAAAGPRMPTPSARSCATLRCVARIAPHLDGSSPARPAAAQFARQAQRRQQVVREAVRELGDEIGA